MYGNNSHMGENTQVQNKIIRVLEESFASNHLLLISLVKQKRNKDYKNPLLFFFTCCPKGKNNTYLRNKPHQIAFKMEVHGMLAVAKALPPCPEGIGINLRITEISDISAVSFSLFGGTI